MRIFLTGATGFIGLPTVGELLAAGHQVLGLARSEAGAALLRARGAAIQRGELGDLDSLRTGAAQADAVIHLGFIHDWANFAESCAVDRRAIEAMAEVLRDTGGRLLVTGGLVGMAPPGQAATESDRIDPDHPFPRVSEQTALALAADGIKASVMRLPQVHDRRKQGLITPLIEVFRARGACAMVGEGRNVFSAAAVADVARLYRLAIEHDAPGAVWHAVAETGVKMADIVRTLAARLDLPVKSLTPAETDGFFGHMARFATFDLPATSRITRERLSWTPVGAGLLEDLAELMLEAG
ncbi:nucleoside-diphosphate-sugar epimerase [Endobacter medicaginis]|uniref:Nucleoside-diphosphate-sugar epimerase n=1 Tax=Endobacter medicaginis TaxID=1181271 RepID=A0A850NV13_9PROT|nr:SDR family oxidoreductase [Endobacter medicaginis]MBB3173835.1 nucleoside-diphosphate-sugar epimerase [Endobacter medicaginis]MCX5477053.1 SDR family oxidoreductase [Endobacter medicaginis]NVN31315.1 SDR family oxidoreductase [Endobacter medicaginis]